MGMFDDVHCEHPELVCSEGHPITKFQTKDLGQDLERYEIIEGRLSGGLWPRDPFTGTLLMYDFCEKCPCFVQAKTGNVCQVWVKFELEFEDNVVQKMTRISEDTSVFLKREPKEPWMKGCEGPMSFEAAEKRRQKIWRSRRRSAGHRGKQR